LALQRLVSAGHRSLVMLKQLPEEADNAEVERMKL